MIKTWIIIAAFLFGSIRSFSQQLSDSLIIEFLNKTFCDYFVSIDSGNHDFYILNDSIPNGLMTEYKDFELYFVDYDQALSLIRKDKVSSLYKVRLNQISIDTVDIVIGGWTVDFKRVFRCHKIEGKGKLVLDSYNFAIWCGGTFGYIPQGRFVFSPELDTWGYISQTEFIDDKFKKYNIK